MGSRYVPAGLLVLAIAAQFAPQAVQAEECILDENNDPSDIADGDGGASSGGTDSSLACGTGASTATLALQPQVQTIQVTQVPEQVQRQGQQHEPGNLSDYQTNDHADKQEACDVPEDIGPEIFHLCYSCAENR